MSSGACAPTTTPPTLLGDHARQSCTPDGQQTYYPFGTNVQMIPLMKERFAKQQTIEAITRKIRDHVNDANELKRIIDAITTVRIWATRFQGI